MRTATAKLTLTDEERMKVHHALNLLQEAQGLINRAAQELCSVRGFSREWSASGRLYDAVKGYWHKVNARRVGLTQPD